MIRPTDGEALSALQSGDLPDPEASALRARLAVEPDLAALAETLRGLDAALAGLPDPPPPAALNRRVLGEERPMQRARWPGLVLALAAGALVGVLLRPSAPVLRLEAGNQRVTGETTVWVGQTRVVVDGDAQISVEPAPPVPRGTGAEVSMTGSHVLAALVGAGVTVAVYEGEARIWPGDGGVPVAVNAGETRTVGPSNQPAGQAPQAERSTPPVTLPEANVRITALEQELAKAKLEAALARGQLAQLEGSPQAFPTDSPAAMGPQGFAETVRGTLADLKLPARLVGTDCEEFPCIAYLEPTGDDPDFERDLQPLSAALVKRFYQDNAGVMAMGTTRETPEGAEKLFAVAIVPGDAAGPSTSSRTQQRVQDFTEARQPTEENEALRNVGYVQ